MDKNKGDISIELCGPGIPEYESILQVALKVLYQRDISVSLNKKPKEEGHYIVIYVKDIGTINREDMTEFLNALFTKKLKKLINTDKVTVTLRDDEKNFALPDEMQECEDWFHIE
ncbi:MAG: hypothetical protein GY845_29090 [Planctomycetes bacterium]|nr:hypothetical protein [Planctomycetota bacterium]